MTRLAKHARTVRLRADEKGICEKLALVLCNPVQPRSLRVLEETVDRRVGDGDVPSRLFEEIAHGVTGKAHRFV